MYYQVICEPYLLQICPSFGQASPTTPTTTYHSPQSHPSHESLSAPPSAF